MWQYYIPGPQHDDFDLTPQENSDTCNNTYCGGYFIPGWGDGTI